MVKEGESSSRAAACWIRTASPESSRVRPLDHRQDGGRLVVLLGREGAAQVPGARLTMSCSITIAGTPKPSSWHILEPLVDHRLPRVMVARRRSLERIHWPGTDPRSSEKQKEEGSMDNQRQIVIKDLRGAAAAARTTPAQRRSTPPPLAKAMARQSSATTSRLSRIGAVGRAPLGSPRARAMVSKQKKGTGHFLLQIPTCCICLATAPHCL